MPKYLFKASYTSEGIKGIQSGGGSRRREVIGGLAEGVGGKLEALYFAFGDADVYAFCEFPDNETAAAVALAVNASDTTSVKTVVLLTPEEVDAAAKRSVGYTPPGG